MESARGIVASRIDGAESRLSVSIYKVRRAARRRYVMLSEADIIARHRAASPADRLAAGGIRGVT
jgi:hypothetical protein